MTSQLMQHKNALLNAAIYIDYENIFELLKKYGVNPLTINFFPVIMDKLKNEYELDIIECIAYGNFEKKSFERHQTILHNLGVQTCHTASQGKNCGDLMLTVDSLTTLYKNPHINVFVVISSDRDMIPLLKGIKRENKFAFMFSTRHGFNPMVSGYADCHEYIEDIFDLKPEMLSNVEEPNPRTFLINPDNINPHDIENAREVSRLLYSSDIWRRFEKEGSPVTLKGYISIISKKISRDAKQIMKDFELADYIGYITLYRDEDRGFCLKKGEKYPEVLRCEY